MLDKLFRNFEEEFDEAHNDCDYDDENSAYYLEADFEINARWNEEMSKAVNDAISKHWSGIVHFETCCECQTLTGFSYGTIDLQELELACYIANDIKNEIMRLADLH